MTITQQTLGSTSPLTVSSLGLGCMGMSEFYGTPDEQGGLDTIHRALDLGVTFLDTADMYGPFTNELLVGRAIAADATTSSWPRSSATSAARTASGSASTARRSTSAAPATPRSSASVSTTSTSTTSTASTRACRSRRPSAP